MEWLEFRVQVPPELVEPVVSLFQRYVKHSPVLEEGGGFNPDEGEVAPVGVPVIVRAYTPLNRRTPWRRARIEAGFQLLSLIRPLPPLEVRVVQAQEWEEAWRSFFRPQRVGRRLVICPQGQEYAPQDSDVVLTLDPGLAFGTGYHPTTRMCLEELEERVRPGMRVLDLGAGTGILALAAAKLGAASVLAVDRDPVAVRATRRNARANGLTRQVRIVRGERPLEEAGGFDLIFANISAKVLIDLAFALAASLASGGTLVASGVLAERGAEVAQRFTESGIELLRQRQEEDWLAFIGLKARL